MKHRDYEVLRLLAERKAGPSKVLYFISILGEMYDDSWQVQNLTPYRIEDLHKLLIQMSHRMEKYQLSPFWEIAGLSADEHVRTLKILQFTGARHPLNAAKWYVSALKRGKNWQEILDITYNFAYGYSLLMKKIEQNKMADKFLAMGRGTGWVKI